MSLVRTKHVSNSNVLNLFVTNPQPVRNYSPSPCNQHICLDSVTYTNLIRSSAKSGCSIVGKLAHAHMIKSKFKPSLFLLNNFLDMYCKCGEMGFAHNMFVKMHKRNVVSFNSLISGYNKMGFYDQVMEAFVEARMAGLKLDKFTYAGALSVCGQAGDVALGKLVHGLVVISGLAKQVFLVNTLIDMYCKCGRLDQAMSVFENADELDQISWNSLISGFLRMGENEEALRLLGGMHRHGLSLTTYTLGSVLKACCSNLDHDLINHGLMLHGCVVKLGMDIDVVVGTALLDMYSKNGKLNDAIKVFKLMPDQNVVMYNAMIVGFLQTQTISNEDAEKIFYLFSELTRREMKPSASTFSSILKACNAVEAFEYGKQMHAQICKYNFQSDEFIVSALIDMYSSYGLVEDGLKCFDSTPKLDIGSWTSLIVGYVRNEQFESAFALFYELFSSGRNPDEFIISTMLSACANFAAVSSGEQVQGYATKSGIEKFTLVKTSQICMYAKSGNLACAKMTFEEVECPDVSTWSALIYSHAQHGFASNALNLFELMRDCRVTPNHITFLGVLTACSHGGLVKEGLRYFKSMKLDYGIQANEKHFSCVVDLLGRAGRLAEAENFILSSCFKDHPVLWRTLLSACRIYKDTTIGKRVADRVIELDPQSPGSYVLLYNIYNDAGIKLPAREARELMKDRCVKKEPGLSWIEVGNKFHAFVAGDRSHSLTQVIYSRLEELQEKINRTSYVDYRAECSASG